MSALPLSLIHFVLSACFHIKIHAARSLLDFLVSLSEQEHTFILQLINGGSLSFIEYSESEHDETLLVRTEDSNDYWTLKLHNNGWNIQKAL